MRLFVDDHGLPFEKAFEFAQRTFAYTNHTLLPEALERWPKPLLQRVAPRHLQIIELINAHFLAEVEVRWPASIEQLRSLSIIEEGHPQHVRMAHLAIVGSHAVNGVSKLHSELVKTRARARLRGALARALPEQDERRLAAPLADEGEPRPRPT